MPRLLTRLPISTHQPLAHWLTVVSVFGFILAGLFFLASGEKTETSGMLWWSETRDVPAAERRTHLRAAAGMGGIAFFALLGAAELWSSVWWRRKVGDSGPRLHDVAIADLRTVYRAAQIEQRIVSERIAKEAAERLRAYEATVEGQAQKSFKAGDEFFSIELQIDASLGRHLSEIVNAGWREVSKSRRTARDGEPQVQTFLFRRDDR